MITIENAGQNIIKTNYWDSAYAQRGLLFLSWNAGACRVLIPDNQESMLSEMRSANYVIVSRGPWHEMGGREGLELLFEDKTDRPFCLHIVAEQCDRMIPETDQGGGFVVTTWMRDGEKLRFPGKYRAVDSIPCLDPWSVQ